MNSRLNWKVIKEARTKINKMGKNYQACGEHASHNVVVHTASEPLNEVFLCISRSISTRTSIRSGVWWLFLFDMVSITSFLFLFFLFFFSSPCEFLIFFSFPKEFYFPLFSNYNPLSFNALENKKTWIIFCRTKIKANDFLFPLRNVQWANWNKLSKLILNKKKMKGSDKKNISRKKITKKK